MAGAAMAMGDLEEEEVGEAAHRWGPKANPPHKSCPRSHTAVPHGTICFRVSQLMIMLSKLGLLLIVATASWHYYLFVFHFLVSLTFCLRRYCLYLTPKTICNTHGPESCDVTENQKCSLGPDSHKFHPKKEGTL